MVDGDGLRMRSVSGRGEWTINGCALPVTGGPLIEGGGIIQLRVLLLLLITRALGAGEARLPASGSLCACARGGRRRGRGDRGAFEADRRGLLLAVSEHSRPQMMMSVGGRAGLGAAATGGNTLPTQPGVQTRNTLSPVSSPPPPPPPLSPQARPQHQLLPVVSLLYPLRPLPLPLRSAQRDRLFPHGCAPRLQPAQPVFKSTPIRPPVHRLGR